MNTTSLGNAKYFLSKYKAKDNFPLKVDILSCGFRKELDSMQQVPQRLFFNKTSGKII